MTLATDLSGARLSAELPRERVDLSDADLGGALMDGISDPVSASSAEADWAGLLDLPPATDAPAEPDSGTDEPDTETNEPATPEAGTEPDLEALLLGGLSDAPSVSSEEAAAPASQPGTEPPAAPERELSPEPADTATAPEPKDADPEPPAGTDADFEDALLAGLSGNAAISPGHGDGPEADFDPDQALPEGLADGASVSTADGGSPVLPVAATPDASAANPAATFPDAEDLTSELLGGLDDGTGTSSYDGRPPGLAPVPGSGNDALQSLPVPPSGRPDDPSRPLDEPSECPIDAAAGGSLPDLPALSPTGDSIHGPVSGGVLRDLEELADPGLPVSDPRPAGQSLPSTAMPDGPVAALAFAADAETETALREGLLHFEDISPGHEDPQVWPGGLRAAVAALAGGHATGLVIVDIDGVPYPAGAMHELAEVCEVGTAVIALGSDGSARASREILLAGVSDYLVKPVSPAAVREAARRAAGAGAASAARGRVAGVAGTGGSGATTIVAATALHAAGQGRYISILDLNRTVSPVALLLDVEPAPGLDQLFDVAGRSPPDPKLLDGVRAERSERIAVYAYRLGPALPPVPPLPALGWLLGELRHRSQLVLVDGLDDPGTYSELPDEVDLRVLVAEPTVTGAARAARMADLLGRAAPMLLVQNHTRAFRPDAGRRLIEKAGIAAAPDAVIPFNRSLPEIAGRGWPGDRIPRGVRGPVAALAERLSMPAPAAAQASGG